ncbi:MAG TPA: HepT-like ribonuclease domain-containing protein [Candidatus Nanoarchaeia archaeon]|nr:HepT-like ribonuclease domain-containing protein [Candidatus Nanoarchaeia archaeon]
MKILTNTAIRKIKDKLDLLEKYHAELVEDLPSEEIFMTQRVPRRALEKTVEIIADTIVDTAMIIISAKGYDKPTEQAEAITVLEKNKILSPLAKKMKDLVRFRNLLVHQYAKIDEKREYESISEDHQDVVDFIKEIDAFLRKEEEMVKKK